MEEKYEKKVGGRGENRIWMWRLRRVYVIQYFCKDLEIIFGKDESSLRLGCFQRNLDRKYFGKEIELYRFIIIGRNFGVRFVFKQKRFMDSWQQLKDVLGMIFFYVFMCFLQIFEFCFDFFIKVILIRFFFVFIISFGLDYFNN